MKLLFILFVILIVNPTEYSPENIQFLQNSKKDFTDLDKYFDQLGSNGDWMGTVSISQNNKLLYQRSIGYSKIGNTKEESILADSLTTYGIGSITKSYTAVLILQLVEEGEIELSTPLSHFYPQISNSDKITIEQLLLHRSGLHNFSKSKKKVAWNDKLSEKQNWINTIAESKAEFKPNSRAAYNNLNYILLGFVIEDLRKMTFWEAVELGVIEKLKPLGYAENHSLPAFSYYKQKNTWQKMQISNSADQNAAGSLLESPYNLNIFAHALFSFKLINAESLSKMTQLNEDYGMGIFSYSFYDKQAFGHAGKTQAFDAQFLYFPEEKLSLSIVSNASTLNVNDILIKILRCSFKN